MDGSPLDLQLLLAAIRRKCYFLEPLWEPKPLAGGRSRQASSKVSRTPGERLTFPNQVLGEDLWLPTLLA